MTSKLKFMSNGNFPLKIASNCSPVKNLLRLSNLRIRLISSLFSFFAPFQSVADRNPLGGDDLLFYFSFFFRFIYYFWVVDLNLTWVKPLFISIL